MPMCNTLTRVTEYQGGVLVISQIFVPKHYIDTILCVRKIVQRQLNEGCLLSQKLITSYYTTFLTNWQHFSSYLTIQA